MKPRWRNKKHLAAAPWRYRRNRTAPRYDTRPSGSNTPPESERLEPQDGSEQSPGTAGRSGAAAVSRDRAAEANFRNMPNSTWQATGRPERRGILLNQKSVRH